MSKVCLCFVVLLCVSCGDAPDKVLKQEADKVFKQEDRCGVDGTNIYVRCPNGSHKILPLGFGNFFLVDNHEIAEAQKLCGQKPEEAIVYVKNAHYKFKAMKPSGSVIVSFQDSHGENCARVEKYFNLNEVKKYKILSSPLTSPPPKEEEL